MEIGAKGAELGGFLDRRGVNVNAGWWHLLL
jgi:hypothetical protein